MMNIHKRTTSSSTNSHRGNVKTTRGHRMRRKRTGRQLSLVEWLVIAFALMILLILIGIYLHHALPLLLSSETSSSSPALSSKLRKIQSVLDSNTSHGRYHKAEKHMKRQYQDDDDDNDDGQDRRRHDKKHIKEDDQDQKGINELGPHSAAPYHHSDYMEKVGDHSMRYLSLRQKYDALLPHTDTKHIQRMKEFVSSLHKNKYQTILPNDMTYDIHNCPLEPPPHYPKAWNVRDVLENWPPDDPDPKTPQYNVYQGICVFNIDTEDDLEKAFAYRRAELPFIVRNDPKVLRSVERWNQPSYMFELFDDESKYRTEHSENNHFMYWRYPNRKKRGSGANDLKDWKPPTDVVRTTFEQWYAHANVTQHNDDRIELRDDDVLGPNNEHWYFIPSSCSNMKKPTCAKNAEWLYDELPFFQPTSENPLYMVEPDEQKGIFCRFGMKGAIAENHFDATRNMVVLLGGERRYILGHPDQCENMELYPKEHPSGRHSAVDWSDPDWEKYEKFQQAEVNEVVLQAGDVLYLPTNWFHYIISLNLNYQCNTRSGTSHEYDDAIKACGFGYGRNHEGKHKNPNKAKH